MKTETHDLGRLYCYVEKRDSRLPLQVARGQMIEEPFRRGLGLALAPFTRTALIVGWWGHRSDASGVRVIGAKTKQVRKWGRTGVVYDEDGTAIGSTRAGRWLAPPFYDVELPWDRLHGVPRVHLGETFEDVVDEALGDALFGRGDGK